MAKKAVNGTDDGKIEGFDIKLTQEHLQRIDRLVDNYESSIAARLDSEYDNQTKKSDRIADKIAIFGGSWKFILIFAVFLLTWMLWNSLSFTVFHFDSPPFILLNLILSFIAAFQAPVIMMSQNRQAARDKHESVIDFAINYKAEQEIDDIQKHLHDMQSELDDIKEMIAKSEHKPVNASDKHEMP
jgi:uncharacterized membrane protein